MIVATLIMIPSFALACSDFQIKARDNSIIIGRSMEYPIDLLSQILVVPRGRQIESIDDKGIKGISWKSKYGYLAVNSFGIREAMVDGFNEKGLSFGLLMYTGAKYEPAVPGKFVTYGDLCAWILGNFSTVEEVKKAISKIKIANIDFKQAKGSLGIHVAVHDASGKNMVIEFINGKKRIHDNPLGVMTNRPDFAWQINNLRNYINLNAHDMDPKLINGIKIEPTGVGSGLLGLPGDWTPPSRFVRLAICVDAALPPKNDKEAILLAQHILNIVDIPMGVITERSPDPKANLYGYAQWVVIKNLTNKVLYFKTYENSAWKSIDLKKLNINAQAPLKSIPIDDRQMTFIDISSRLK